ncbi:MAG: MBL fold metallo-hydrolase, partial [Thermodesulfovibrionales bacterium]|nr:MBL fold metallo-hydrolase [Thermodesulfovibrionales bacterium]
NLTVTFLDVGQGDSAVIELSDKKVIVIDSGKDGFHTSNYLKYRGIKEISAFVISHPQKDHVGGFERMASDFKINEVWDNGLVEYLKDYGIKKVSLSRGDVFQGDDYKIFVFHPHDDFIPDKNAENNLSLVIKICGRANCFLFTGDIEIEAIEDINRLGSYLQSDVLKIPHHGSKTSGDAEFISLVSPRYAVISVGKDNKHGLPHAEVLTLLSDIKVFRTDVDGAIRFREDKTGGLEVLTYKDFTLKPKPDIHEEWLNIKRLFYRW